MRARGAGCPAGLLAVGWLILVGLQASQASNVTSSGGGVQEPAVAREGESESESESEEEAENEGEVPESETTAEADAEEEGEGSGSLGTEAPEEARSPSFCRKELPVPSSVGTREGVSPTSSQPLLHKVGMTKRSTEKEP